MAKYLLLHDERGEPLIVKAGQISIVTRDWQRKDGGSVLTNDFGEDRKVRETVEEIGVLLGHSVLVNADQVRRLRDWLTKWLDREERLSDG